MRNSAPEPQWAIELSELAGAAVQRLSNRADSKEFRATSRVLTLLGVFCLGTLTIGIAARNLGALVFSLGLLFLLGVVFRHRSNVKNAWIGQLGHLWVSRFARSTFLVDPQWPERLGRLGLLPRAKQHTALLDNTLQNNGAFEPVAHYRDSVPGAKEAVEIDALPFSELRFVVFGALPGVLFLVLAVASRTSERTSALLALLGCGVLIRAWIQMRRGISRLVARVEGDDVIVGDTCVPVRSVIALELMDNGELRVWVHQQTNLVRHSFPRGQETIAEAILKHGAFRRPVDQSAPSRAFVRVN